MTKVWNGPNSKHLQMTNKKLLSDDFSLDRVKNSVGKGENAGLPTFFPFQKCFPKPSFSYG